MVLMPEEEAQVMNTQRNLLAIPQRERAVAQGKFMTSVVDNHEAGSRMPPRLAKPTQAWGDGEDTDASVVDAYATSGVPKSITEPQPLTQPASPTTDEER